MRYLSRQTTTKFCIRASLFVLMLMPQGEASQRGVNFLIHSSNHLRSTLRLCPSVHLQSLLPLTAPLAMQKRFMSQARPPIIEEYAKATTDTAFKHMLSPNEESNKELLISFLNTFVPAFRGDHVQRVEAMTSSLPVLPKLGEKQTFMDLRVQSETGNQYIVEMQARRHVMFDERALYYAASVYARQSLDQRGQEKTWYHYLKPVIALQILDYDTNRVRGIADIPDSIKDDERSFVERVKSSPMKKNQFIKHYMMTDAISGQKIDYLQLLQIELPRAERIKPPQHMTKENMQEWWINILAHADDYTHEDVNRMYQQEKVMPDIIYKALDRLDVNKWNPAMVKEYKEDLIEKDRYAAVLEVEKAEGKKEGKKEIARKMLDRGRPLAEIEEDTGLTQQEIESLKKSVG